jgi:tetratricopeptide (TPR) repeat protein
MLAVARMMAWTGVVLGTVYVLFIGGGWWGIYSPYLRLATMLITAAALVLWVLVAWRNRAWRPKTTMGLAFVAVLGTLTLSTIFSRQPRISLEYLGYAVVLSALYLLLVRLLADKFFQRRVISLFAMLFAVSTALYVGSVFVGWVEWWRLTGALTIPPLRPGFGGLTYGNPSAALTMITLLGVPVVGAFGGQSRRGRIVVVGVIAIVGIVAVMSGSRAGWFALALTTFGALVSVVVVSGFRRAALAAIRSTVVGRPWLFVALVAALGGAVIGVAPAVLERVFAGGEDLRVSYAVAAIRMFIDARLVGTGLGTWVIQRPGAIAAGEPDYYIPHAHNIEVQTLAELGFIGAIAGVVLLASIVRLLRGAIDGTDSSDRRTDSSDRQWAWAACLGLGYFFLHQLLDFYVNMPAFLFAAVLPVAYLDARALEVTARRADAADPDDTANLPRLLRIAAAAVVALAVAGLTWQEIPALRESDAVTAAGSGSWTAADSSAREAAEMDPGVTSYHFTAGLTAAAVGDHVAAAAYFERVVAVVDLPEGWLNLAAEEAQVGDREAALTSIERSMRLGQQRPAISMPAGDLALRLGDAAAAREAFTAAVAARPSLAGDPWFRADPERAAMLEAILKSAETRAPKQAWEIRLEAGLPTSADTPIQQVIADAWTGDSAALDTLLRDCANHPIDASLLGWCARVSRRHGESGLAEVFMQRVKLISIGAAEGAAELRVSPDGMVGVQMPGGPADLWATYTYRRPAPWDVLVGSLIHLRLE